MDRGYCRAMPCIVIVPLPRTQPAHNQGTPRVRRRRLAAGGGAQCSALAQVQATRNRLDPRGSGPQNREMSRMRGASFGADIFATRFFLHLWFFLFARYGYSPSDSIEKNTDSRSRFLATGPNFHTRHFSGRTATIRDSSRHVSRTQTRILSS